MNEWESVDLDEFFVYQQAEYLPTGVFKNGKPLEEEA